MDVVPAALVFAAGAQASELRDFPKQTLSCVILRGAQDVLEQAGRFILLGVQANYERREERVKMRKRFPYAQSVPRRTMKRKQGVPPLSSRPG